MSLLERRLQLLLDHDRYDRLEAEARRSGRSVAAVIREAIDFRFGADDVRRAAAGRRLLALNDPPEGLEPDFAETKQMMAEELEARLG